MDNNVSESINYGFCIEKKNWQMIDTIYGVKEFTVICGIVETVKSKSLKLFDYVQYLLEKILKYMDSTDRYFFKNLLLWPRTIPREILKK